MKPRLFFHAAIDVVVRFQMIKCSVCQDKKKNRVITKCFHMFCDGCLEKSIKVRERGRERGERGRKSSERISFCGRTWTW